MGRAIETARAVKNRIGALLGGVDEVLQRFVWLLVVDQQHDRVGDQARERNEIGAGGLGRAVEQLVHLGVT